MKFLPFQRNLNEVLRWMQRDNRGRMSSLNPMFSVFNYCYYSKTICNISYIRFYYSFYIISKTSSQLLTIFCPDANVYRNDELSGVKTVIATPTESLIFIWQLKPVFKEI